MDDRVTLGSRRIERSQLRPGDHIYAWFGVYAHHGIYQGDDKVIDFTVDAQSGLSASASSSSSTGGGVVRCHSLGSFLGGHDIRLFVYSVPWWFYKASIRPNGFQDTCSMEHEDPPERVLRRANYHLNHGFGDYNITLRNCFDFAFYCKTGHPYYSLPAIVDGSLDYLIFGDSPSFSASDLGRVIHRWFIKLL